MLPSYLSSSYQQYKQDTDAIAAWLASTARRCGYPVDLLQPASAKDQPPPRSRRLKGKARKQAKAAGKSSNQAPEQTTKGPSYIIAINDFVTLAEFIAGSKKPRVKVPSTVATVLDRAIDVRKKHAQSLPAQQDEDEDKRHSYFVGVLERVQDILKPYISLEVKAQEQAKTTEEVGHLGSYFAHLEVSEPSEAFNSAPDVARPSKPEPEYQSEQAEDPDEACTAFALLLEDFARLRTVISKTWVAYKIGMCDIVAASVTTITALELARHLEEDAASLLERNGGVERMLMSAYIAGCLIQGQDHDDRSHPDDDLNYQTYDMDTSMWPTYSLLRAFVQLVSPTNVPIYQAGFYGTYDPSSDRRQKNAKEKHLEDKIMLMEILPEFALLCRMRDALPVEDELVRGLQIAFDTKKITLWTILAVQVFLDIHHRMRSQVNRGLEDMEKAANQISSSIEQHFKLHSSLTIDTWPSSNDAFFRDLTRRIATWAKGDPIRRASLQHHRPPPPNRNLLSKHPLFCGLLAYGFKIQFNEAGIALANAWGSIVSTAHPYNAACHYRPLQRPWTDMEILRALQPTILFERAPPTAPDAYLKRFMLSMGYSAANFAPNRRRHARPQVSRSGPRGLADMDGVAQAFKGRFAGGGGTAGFSDADLRNLLGRLNAWEEDYELSDREEEGDGVQAFGLTKSAGARDGKAARTARERAVGGLAMDALLERLRNALQGEVLELSFYYLLMHRFCWRLLRAVKEECAEEMRRMYGPAYIERETELPFVVGHVLLAAVTKGQAADYPMFRARRSEGASSRLLGKAARVLDGMMEAGAGAMVAKVLEMQYGIAFEID